MAGSWSAKTLTLLLGLTSGACSIQAHAPEPARGDDMDASRRIITPAGEDADTADASLDGGGPASTDGALEASASIDGSAGLGDAGRERDAEPGLDAAGGMDGGVGMDASTCVDGAVSMPGVAELGCDPRWRPMPSVPEGFGAFYSENPSCLLNVEWVSCGRGCRHLADDPRFLMRSTGLGWAEPTGAFFLADGVVRGSCFTGPNSIRVVASTDGVVVAAFLIDYPQVRPSPTAGGDGWMGFDLAFGREDAEGHLGTVHHLLYHAPRAAFTGAVEPVLALSSADPPWRAWDAAGPDPWSVAVSATTLSADVYELERMLVVESSRARWFSRPGHCCSVDRPRVLVVGHQSFWGEWGEVRQAAIDTEVSTFLPPHAAGRIQSFATDGVDLTWVMADPDSADICELPGLCHPELWTAPYVSDPGALGSRLVSRRLDVTGEAVIGDGVHVSFDEYDRDSVALNLRDGRRRRWDVPPRWRVYPKALWTHAGEVAFMGSVHGTRPDELVLISLADGYRAVP